MKIEVGELITLGDEKDFLVVNAKEMEGQRYLFLISNYKPVEVRFGREIMNENGSISLEIINNQETKLKLVELFKEQ